MCVLGLNKNKGEAIYLRLRTDDLKGFRKLLNIKKVLYHELAHNEHSDHDDKFYMLMRQIEREVVNLDWRQNSKGHVLGSTGGFKEDSFQSPEPSSEKKADSATIASSTDENQDRQQDLSSPTPLQSAEEGSSSCEWTCPCGCAPTLQCPTCVSFPADKKADGVLPVEEVEINSIAHERERTSLSSPSSKPEVDEQAATVLIQLISDRIMSGIDETLASFYALQQEPPERIVQLRQAMYEMLMTVGGHMRFKEEVNKQSIAQVLETLSLLRDIINRAKVWYNMILCMRYCNNHCI